MLWTNMCKWTWNLSKKKIEMSETEFQQQRKKKNAQNSGWRESNRVSWNFPWFFLLFKQCYNSRIFVFFLPCCRSNIVWIFKCKDQTKNKHFSFRDAFFTWGWKKKELEIIPLLPNETAFENERITYRWFAISWPMCVFLSLLYEVFYFIFLFDLASFLP